MVYGQFLTVAVIGGFLLAILTGQIVSQPLSGDVRLAGSQNGTQQGRVEIYHNGSWGTVCDDSWDMNEGNVVCRQLGYTGAIAVFSNAYFGQGTGNIWMDDVMCTGNESRLEDCPHRGWGKHYCYHSGDAGVACENITHQEMTGGNCSFETSFCGYKNLYSDDFDWKRSTSYNWYSYRPRHDHTTGYGRYIYAESNYRTYTGSKAQIISPQLKGIKCVHFYYFMKGYHVGQFNMYVKYGSNKTLLWQNDGPQAAVWIKAIIPIMGIPSPFQIIFESVSGGTYAADIALDDVQAFQENCVLNTTGNCTFEPGVMCGYTNPSSNVAKWLLHKGRIGYYGIGPYKDHTTGSGYYVYLKTTYQSRYQTSKLISPEIYEGRCIKFNYFMGGSSTRELSVFIDDGVKKTAVWRLDGRHGNVWKDASLPVKRNLKSFKLIFEGFPGGSYYNSRIALDDIFVLNKPCKVFPSEASVEPIDIGDISKEVRLAGSSANYSGRVEVFYNGRWGTICGTNFPLTSARVVCRQLGFLDALMVVPCCSMFGAGQGRVFLQSVKCRGEEPDIKMCSHSPWGITSCYHTQDVGVVCKSGHTEKDARLNGSNSFQGKAEVRIGGVWGFVSDSGWDIYDADVFCREAGFKGASEVLNHGRGWSNRGLVWIGNTNCNGDEKSFWDCNYTTIAQHYGYYRYRDAGAKCYDLKLVGGKTKNEGIVLIKWEGTWGTICNDSWDILDAHVTCRNLGYTKAKSSTIGYRINAPSNISILLSQFECRGDEPSLATCRRRSLAQVSHQCTHDSDAAVVCINEPHTGGSTPIAPITQKPTTSPVTLVCKQSKKYGKICICSKNDENKPGCYVVGVEANCVTLWTKENQWDTKRFKQQLAKQLTKFCANISCGHDSSSSTAYDVIVVSSDLETKTGQVVVKFLVFDFDTKNPIKSDIIKSMTTQDDTLAGYKVYHFHQPQPPPEQSEESKKPNVVMIIAIAIGALIFCAVVVFALLYRKRKRRLRALVRYHVPGSPPELKLSDDEDDAREDDRLLRLDDNDQAALLPSASTVVA